MVLQAKVNVEYVPLDCPPLKSRDGQSEMVGSHLEVKESFVWNCTTILASVSFSEPWAFSFFFLAVEPQ